MGRRPSGRRLSFLVRPADQRDRIARATHLSFLSIATGAKPHCRSPFAQSSTETRVRRAAVGNWSLPTACSAGRPILVPHAGRGAWRQGSASSSPVRRSSERPRASLSVSRWPTAWRAAEGARERTHHRTHVAEQEPRRAPNHRRPPLSCTSTRRGSIAPCGRGRDPGLRRRDAARCARRPGPNSPGALPAPSARRS